MRNLLLIVAILALPLLGANAQSWSYGLKGGLNYSTDIANYKDAAANGISLKPEAKSSFYFAALAEYACSEKWSIQGELMYSENGGNSFIPKGGVDALPTSPLVNGDLTVSELSMPFMVKRHFGKMGKFSVGLGVSFGYISAQKFAYNEPTVGGSNTISVPSNDVDFGLIGGLEYKFTKHLFIDARYNYGLTNTAANSYAANLGPLTYNTRNAQIGIGYRFK